METRTTFTQRIAPYLLSILRMMTAALFIEHGTQKLFDFPPGGHTVSLAALSGAAGLKMFLSALGALLEFGGGALMLIGLFVRPTAFILAGQMAVAYFMMHAPAGFYPVLNRGELAVLYCFVFLYFAAAGGGPWSLDQLFRRKTAAPSPVRENNTV